MNALKSLTVAVTLSLALAGCQAPTTASVAGGKAIAAKTFIGLPGRAPAAKRQPTQVLVKFKAQMQMSALSAFRAEFGTRNVGMIESLGVYVEEVTTGASLATVLKAMQASPLVEYAEPNGEVGIQQR